MRPGELLARIVLSLGCVAAIAAILAAGWRGR
jgi:hypothetical protein